MALIKSISGIRGTIGGAAGDNLTPQDIVECTAAFGYWVIQKTNNPKIVVGRDARISGEIVNSLVVSTLRSLGIDVIDLGLSTTPTVEVAVPMENAGAGIILTASHNPKQWNALKLLNDNGEFISAADATEFLALIEAGNIEYASVDELGSYRKDDTYIEKHINAILSLPLVTIEKVKAKQFKVVVDCVNSTGAISIPPLLERLGCEVVLINEAVTGKFAHNPEPLPENLRQLSEAVISHRADLGIAVDPDVDRLAFVSEDGEMFGEEYTLVTVADYILRNTPKGKSRNTVSNLSSTRALRDVTEKNGGTYSSAAVGEVNVVNQMKVTNAVIGGEGNGGIIYPELHYGRDALVGIALVLSQLAEYGKPISWLRRTFPSYVISKNKIQLTPELDLDLIFDKLKDKYKNEELDTIDGLKILFESDWIHLRKSNTEPIIRIYSESASEVTANNLAKKIQLDISDLLKNKVM
ncbi:phosphoglucosamine mutase [Saprospiraceae bacterium]|nr:phosphoglucosamine mutase [Saprospiraceae bacterium]MDG1433868.1 phosphoglucosamine mutase [Saprospiraceae bacterium]